jgi:hypothetical protein
MITISPPAAAVSGGGGTPVYLATSCATLDPGAELADNYIEGLPQPLHVNTIMARVAFEQAPPDVVTLSVSIEEYSTGNPMWTHLNGTSLNLSSEGVSVPAGLAVILSPSNRYRFRMGTDVYQPGSLINPTVWLQGVLRDS